MPITLKQLREETKELCLPVGDDRIIFSYRVNAFTPEMEEMLHLAEDDEVKSRSIREMVKRLVVRWDLKEDEKDKHFLPITDENLLLIPTKILVEMITAIGEDLSPDPTLAANS